ncbi:hypothetical protein [Methyloceanibacter sp.]|jgi:hypothetical protein|uniref:hypothetical protein n=1 Tax=Methyloceanibacter sp. TaxID=1965321 RepID=UPI002C9739E0|nr:hypothetical protein [Methyloceanibacter sp.]
MFAVIFDAEQDCFLSRLAEPRDKKKTKLAFRFDGKQENAGRAARAARQHCQEFSQPGRLLGGRLKL